MLAALAVLCNACTQLLGPPRWTDYYDPRYPDHQAAYELCEAASDDDAAFARCMLDSITPHGASARSLTGPADARR